MKKTVAKKLFRKVLSRIRGIEYGGEAFWALSTWHRHVNENHNLFKNARHGQPKGMASDFDAMAQ